MQGRFKQIQSSIKPGMKQEMSIIFRKYLNILPPKIKTAWTCFNKKSFHYFGSREFVSKN